MGKKIHHAIFLRNWVGDTLTVNSFEDFFDHWASLLMTWKMKNGESKQKWKETWNETKWNWRCEVLTQETFYFQQKITQNMYL